MSQPEARPQDVEDLDGIVKALYEAISFPAGGKPDWERLRTLFAESAILVPAPDAPGHLMEVLDLEGFISGTVKQIEAGAARAGFHEAETGRRVDSYGAVTHLMSTYETRHAATDPKPFAAGVNSIQLIHHSGRYWVASLVWDHVTPELPPPVVE